jgi:hypothetical protein
MRREVSPIRRINQAREHSFSVKPGWQGFRDSQKNALLGLRTEKNAEFLNKSEI